MAKTKQEKEDAKREREYEKRSIKENIVLHLVI